MALVNDRTLSPAWTPPLPWAKALCVYLLGLNGADAAFTFGFLQLDLATEANPLMGAAYELSPLAFLGCKLLMVQAGAWILLRESRRAAVRIALAGVTAAYAGVVGYHIGFLALLARG